MIYINAHDKKNPIDRRRFLYQSALGLGALSLGIPMVSCAESTANGTAKEKLGIALVGLGGYATNQLAPALLETQHCYLAGIVTGTPAKKKTWMDKYNIPDKNVYNYDSFDKIMDNDDIDIIYVVLPNSLHKEYTIRAAKAGKHIICEKPMALNVADCQAMIDACKANNVRLSIGYRLHFDPFHQKLMEIARNNESGAVKYVQAEFGFRIGDPTQWRLKKALAGGGAIMDVGVYCIQGARYATGEEPIAVTAREFKTDPVKFAEVDETVTWQMEFPSGVVANCTTSYNLGTNRLYLNMEKTTVEIEPAYSYGGIKGRIGNNVMEIEPAYQQAKQMDAFALNIKENTPSEVSGQEGLLDLKVVEAMYASIAGNGERILIK